jgi:hypothetical protein
MAPGPHQSCMTCFCLLSHRHCPGCLHARLSVVYQGAIDREELSYSSSPDEKTEPLQREKILAAQEGTTMWNVMIWYAVSCTSSEACKTSVFAFAVQLKFVQNCHLLQM